MKRIILRSLVWSWAAALALCLTGCDDDGIGAGKTEKQGAFFISAMFDGAEYLIQTENIESGEISLSSNFSGDLESAGYTWIFNTDPSVAVGLIYNQGEPGIGLIYGVNSSGAIEKAGNGFQISSRFTSYGFFDRYAVTSVGGVTPADANGNALLHDDGVTERTDGVTFNRINLSNLSLSSSTILTLDEFREGEQATFSGVVDLGNGTFMTGVVVSQARDESAEGGSSSGIVNYPDEGWVAVLDANFNIVKKFKSEKISYPSGRYRSQYYSQIGKTEGGDIYIFSGSYDESTSQPCGAVKVNGSLDGFDEDYYFNIQAKSDNHLFRKVWHITGDYFLLELYDQAGPITSTLAPANKYAVVNMTSQTFTWVTGLPAYTDGKTSGLISSGLPMAYNGKMYFPITEHSQSPALYVMNPATGVAAKGLVVSGAESVRAVGRLIEE